MIPTGGGRLAGRGTARLESMRSRIRRGLATGALLAAVAGALLAGCGGVATRPLYTQAELRTMCERRGGSWRGDLIPDYCEFKGPG
jgi:hypothetical protein